MRRVLTTLTLVASMSLLASAAHAGGLEYTGQGAQSLARGGAVAARAEDPMVLAHNPAGLAELRGSQLLLNLNFALFDACVEPAGYYGWGVYLGGKPTRLTDPDTGRSQTIELGKIDPVAKAAVAQGYYTDPLDKICLEQTSTPIPQLAWTRRLTEDLGIGFGFIFPAVKPSGHWGAGNGVIEGKNGELRPAPTRYMMLSSNNLGLFPNLGIGYRLFEQLRLGFAFEWGLIGVDTFTMAAATGGTNPANDIIAHVKAQDWFIPGFTASAHVVPVDAIDIVVAFRYQDDLDATGDIDLTTGSFDPSARSFTNGSIPITSLTQHMPWKLRAGIRWADRFAPRPIGTGRYEAEEHSPDRIHDPLQDERFDLELDVEYQMNARNDAQVLKYEQRNLFFYSVDPMAMPSSTVFPAVGEPDTVIEKNWKDQLSVRFGGTWNAFPGIFGISAGTHYETRGVDPDYMQIDEWPVERLGLHTGIIVRFAKRVDFVISYAHIFQETIVVAAPTHQTRDVIDMERLANKNGIPTQIDKTVGAQVDRAGNGLQVLNEQSQGPADGTARLDQNVSRSAMSQPSYLINAGTYRSNMDVIAAGFNVHF